MAPLQRVLMVGVFLAASVISVVGTPQIAQAQDLGQVISPILVVDREQIFAESNLGQSILARLNEKGAELAIETRKIVSDLEAEELNLSLVRPTLSADDFRALAEAFDTKVQRLREERSLAEETHLSEIESARGAFLVQVNPILATLMQEAGAIVLMERRAVVISANSVDITLKAIARIDAVFINEAAPVDGVDGSE